jgi:hypothetical protein
LHHDLNPPHDTRHDTRLPILTEVDGLMNPLAKLDDTTRTQRFGVKPVCYENVSNVNYIHPGSVFIPCHGMTPNGLRAQYFIPNLSPSAIAIHPFVPSARATSSRNPTKSAQIDSLPNGSQLPTASSFAESSWKTFLLPDGFFHQSGPTIQTLSCAKFWC